MQFASLQAKIHSWARTTNRVLTMPGYCTHYTIQQLINIKDQIQRSQAVLVWEENEKSQLNFVAVAATLVASVVGQSLAWPQTNDTHWMVAVLWYGSLFMSLWCVIIAFHLSMLFSAFDVKSDRAGALLDMLKRRGKDEPRKHHLWVLQTPIALFSWAVISYMIGLGVLILRPFWTAAWNRDCWVSSVSQFRECRLPWPVYSEGSELIL